MGKHKIKIAIFDLTDCEGCEVQFLALKEKLLDYFQDLEIVNWRFLQKTRQEDYFDVAFIEGFVANVEDINSIRTIRQKTQIVVALGTCAATGNFFAQFNNQERKHWAQKIYSSEYKLRAKITQPLHDFIKVDYTLNGCPVDAKEVENFIQKIPVIITSKERGAISRRKERATKNYITNIEGHGRLHIDFAAERMHLEINEGERLLEGLLIGKKYDLAPYMTSRICGVCPTAHNLTSLKAIEDAFGLKISDYDLMLRKILLNAQIIQSHLLHLFFLVLPDYSQNSSGLELAQQFPAEFHLALNIKRICDQILTVIGGRAVHPTNTCVGGFLKYPKQNELSSLREGLYDTIDEVEDLVKIFGALKPYNFFNRTNYVAPKSENDYELYDIRTLKAKNQDFVPKNYKKYIKEKVSDHSTAKYALFADEPFMVGALARVHNNNEVLSKSARKTYQTYKKQLESSNPFYNNLAQAIEILNCYENNLSLLNNLMGNYKGGEKPEIKIRAGEGLGIVEAPRGTLYHYYKIDGTGKIIYADIITPTVQNLANLERDCQKLLRITGKLPNKKRRELIERLIRAYDPCITCSVH